MTLEQRVKNAAIEAIAYDLYNGCEPDPKARYRFAAPIENREGEMTLWAVPIEDTDIAAARTLLAEWLR